MTEPMISVRNLGKQYRLGATHGESYRVLRDVIASAFKPRRAKHTSRQRETIWALRDACFDVTPGEALGVIGANGAGKTTLLKLLSRITEPTTGEIRLRGRVASLLEVGTGFHPELTGTENIFLNGSILGMTRSEIKRKFDDIVSFAGVETFLDTPVKRYSSGMHVRLAFAIAAHLDPDVLLVDEVLAVGDAEFQRKCLGRMEEVASGGRTVLFVSHNMAAVLSLCSRSLWLDKGRIVSDGPTRDCVHRYLSQLRGDVGLDSTELGQVAREGSGTVKVQALSVCGEDDNGVVYPSRPVLFKLQLEADTESRLSGVNVAVGINSLYGERLLTLFTKFDRQFNGKPPGEKKAVIICRTETLPLGPGKYRLTVWVERGGEVCDHARDVGEMCVENDDFYGTGHVPSPMQGPLMVDQQWYWTLDSVLQAAGDEIGGVDQRD